MDAPIVTELIQEDCTTKRIKEELLKIEKNILVQILIILTILSDIWQ